MFVLVLLGGLVAGPASTDVAQGPTVCVGGVGFCDDHAVAISAGTLIGAAVGGGGLLAAGLLLLGSGSCQGAGCEGPAGMVLFSPLGAVAGGGVGVVVALASDEPAPALSEDPVE